jgi:hypothetical protein
VRCDGHGSLRHATRVTDGASALVCATAVRSGSGVEGGGAGVLLSGSWKEAGMRGTRQQRRV